MRHSRGHDRVALITDPREPAESGRAGSWRGRSTVDVGSPARGHDRATWSSTDAAAPETSRERRRPAGTRLGHRGARARRRSPRNRTTCARAGRNARALGARLPPLAGAAIVARAVTARTETGGAVGLAAAILCGVLVSSCGRLSYARDPLLVDAAVAPRDSATADAASDASRLTDAGVSTDVDSGGACSALPCRVVLPQCGCEAPLACFLDTAGQPACASPPAAPRIVGASCSGAGSCAPGLACVARAGAGVCVQICAADADCFEGLCTRGLDAMSGSPTPYSTCSIPCDPLTAGGVCGAGRRCVLAVFTTASGSRTVADCEGPIGGGADGAACIDYVQCAVGHACISGSCRQLCALASPVCPSGLACNARSYLVSDVGNFGLCE